MTGNVVILDSGFCVLLSVIALKKMGVLSAVLINKIRYWPRYLKGEKIKALFEYAPVGDSQILPGKINGVNFDLFFLKDPDYVMTLISTYGSLHTHPNQKKRFRTNDKGKFLKRSNIRRWLWTTTVIVVRWMSTTHIGNILGRSMNWVQRRHGRQQGGKFAFLHLFWRFLGWMRILQWNILVN